MCRGPIRDGRQAPDFSSVLLCDFEHLGDLILNPPLYYCPLVIVFYLILSVLISLDLPMDRGDLDVHS